MPLLEKGIEGRLGHDGIILSIPQPNVGSHIYRKPKYNPIRKFNKGSIRL
jgi:hypothetical protein